MAYWENVDPFKVVTMCLFNDIHEARINDLHKMGHSYIDFKEAEKRVFDDQIGPIDQRVRAPLAVLRREYDAQETLESKVARDADILECLIQAKEYLDSGYQEAEHFFQTAPDHLATGTARGLWERMRSWDSSAWWQSVVKFER
jgi:putative hydrolase of HD superfamily